MPMPTPARAPLSPFANRPFHSLHETKKIAGNPTNRSPAILSAGTKPQAGRVLPHEHLGHEQRQSACVFQVPPVCLFQRGCPGLLCPAPPEPAHWWFAVSGDRCASSDECGVPCPPTLRVPVPYLGARPSRPSARHCADFRADALRSPLSGPNDFAI